MKIRALLMSGVIAFACCGGGSALASETHYVLVKKILVPGKPLTGFDISYIDQNTGYYFLADDANSGVDEYDIARGKFVRRFGGFKGFHGDISTAGPAGLEVVDGNLWASNGDGTVRIYNLATGALIHTVQTGGKDRADEMGYDPKDQIMAVENDSDNPPFVTLVSTKPSFQVLGHLAFPEASGGLEEPTYNANNGNFYLSVPNVGASQTDGEIAVINPVTVKVERTLPVHNCLSAGLAFGPNGNFVLGCDAGSDDSKLPPLTLIMSDNGKVVASIDKVGGTDEVAYNPVTNQYFVAAAGMPGGGVIGVIDAATNQWVENVPTGMGHSHSIAVDDKASLLAVPQSVKAAGCGKQGCVGVYAPTVN